MTPQSPIRHPVMRRGLLIGAALGHRPTPALQDLTVADADALAPDDPFDVVRIDSSHWPFASRPDELAAILAGVA